MTSLRGAPEKVIGKFDCGKNKLTTLEYGPKIVEGDFVCSFNYKLSSLEHGPSVVTGDYYAQHIPLTSQGRQSVIECQKELIEAGLENFAKL